jgi:hypothetical protein
MRLTLLRPFVCLALLALLPARALADRVEDIARIHLEAVGGADRLAALKSLRMTGVVYASGKDVKFTMLAQRPAMVRVETQSAGRTLLQAYDGTDAPWEFDSSAAPARQYRAMPDAAAKIFLMDAEFDDPLVAGETRGYSFDYAGEVDFERRKLLRLLVTRKLTDTFSLLLDEDTYFIVKRVEFRTSAGGRKLQVVTHYDDFRPVEGVLLPHNIKVSLDGRLTQETKITRVEANPVIAPGYFTRPKVVLPAAPSP